MSEDRDPWAGKSMSESIADTIPASEFVKALLSGERVIAFHTSFARLGGSVNAGIFLSQLLYWTPKSSKNGWVYKTKAEWENETLLSPKEVDGCRRVWKELGILEEMQPKGTDRTLFYRIDFKRLVGVMSSAFSLSERSITQNGMLEDADRRDVHYAETTTETTSQDTGQKAVALTLYDQFKRRIQPKSRTYPEAKIIARLKTFKPEEIAVAINHFADDSWYMENNAHQGADWFFESDKRIEKFLNMTPRQRGGEGNGTANETGGSAGAAARKPSGLEKYG